MAPTPEIEDAFTVLSDLADRIDFGFHVTLTSEWDNLGWGGVSAAASALHGKDGTLPRTVSALEALKPDLDSVMEEVSAQYDRLVSIGFKLSYLDEHMNVGEIDGLGDRLNAFAKEKGLICDRELRAGAGITDIPGWNGPGEHPGTELADHLSSTPPGTYRLVGHPGFKDEELRNLRIKGQPAGRPMQTRNRQRRMFADIEIVDYCENVGVTLLRYSEL
jgi:hypothetical protein